MYEEMSTKENINMKSVGEKKKEDVNYNLTVVVDKKNKKNSMNKTKVLSKELINQLNSTETKFKSIDELHGRPKIVNWLEVIDYCIEQEWCTAEMIKNYVLASYDKPKLYYSEVLRFLRCNRTNKLVQITSKEIESGEHKNVYYKLVKRK